MLPAWAFSIEALIAGPLPFPTILCYRLALTPFMQKKTLAPVSHHFTSFSSFN
jgi:hypothetical protein